jgi:hypothetical protein
LKVVVYFLVMNHLTKQKNPFVRIVLKGFIADLDCILNPVTKTEMSGQIKLHGAEVEKGRRKVLLSQIFRTANFFYPSGY